MEYESHDQNFKNLFLDFPTEALKWLAPDVLEEFGQIQQVEFVRQEPKKRTLTDAHLALDMPILFTLERAQVVLWLVEFQEDKAKFSIYTLSHYTLEMLEAYPDALILPTVLFTDRTRWRKDVLRELDNTFRGRVFLHFEYLFIKLFEYHARDFYHIRNPVVKILLPKMNYTPEERADVICHAYFGLFQLVSRALFDKYVDFIDIYAQITKDEREALYHTLEEQKETVMLAQYIREKAVQQGIQEGTLQWKRDGLLDTIEFGLNLKFGVEGLRLMPRISDIHNLSLLKTIKEAITTVQDVNKLDILLEQEQPEQRGESPQPDR